MHEIGIRMAVGASRMAVVQMIVGQGIRLSLIGIVIGTFVALMFGRALPSFSHLLYGVESSDPLTLVCTSLALMSIAILACLIPARRASRLDPAIALRNE
jgi:putative ABC transport system permease protein